MGNRLCCPTWGRRSLSKGIGEIEAAQAFRDDFIALIQGKHLSTFRPGAHRRFIVPKDEVSYRQATQLDPQDSILLSAIVYEYGQGIEDRRLPPTQVLSYRFSPSAKDGLYSGREAWNKFWSAAYKNSQGSGSVVYCDVADFYNQIYHHTVENQLVESGLPNQAMKWVIALLESTTAGVSRGVPIGPHAVHLQRPFENVVALQKRISLESVKPENPWTKSESVAVAAVVVRNKVDPRDLESSLICLFPSALPLGLQNKIRIG